MKWTQTQPKNWAKTKNEFRPVLDRDFRILEIHLRPWKGKVDLLRMPVHVELNENPLNKLDLCVEHLKKSGKFKRRTIIKVSIYDWKNIKL